MINHTHIEWFYKDITTNSQNPIFQKLMNMDKNMKVVFKTDELGSFVEVLNWKEIKKHIKKATSSLRQDSKCRPEVEYALKQIEANLSKNKAFEPASIKHIKQFHSFHGVEYKLGEVLEGTFNGPNLYSPEPFGASFTICLEEINEKDNNFLMRTTQEVNKEQLIDATFNYLTTMANNMKVDPPKREDLKNLEKKTLLESRIDVTGWVVYSVQTITTTLDSVTNIEERMIKLK